MLKAVGVHSVADARQADSATASGRSGQSAPGAGARPRRGSSPLRSMPAMTRTLLLCAIGVSVWSAAVAGSQAPAPVVLSGTLRAHIKNERFDIVTSVRGLPLGVRDELQTLFGSPTLDIAEPGAAFQATDVVLEPGLPTRRLVAAGCSIDHCLVYYERGGIAHTWQAALFHWTPAMTRLEGGGNAPGGLSSIDDVRNAILSGAIKGPAKVW
jgi:hypothetical protein